MTKFHDEKKQFESELKTFISEKVATQKLKLIDELFYTTRTPDLMSNWLSLQNNYIVSWKRILSELEIVYTNVGISKQTEITELNKRVHRLKGEDSVAIMFLTEALANESLLKLKSVGLNGFVKQIYCTKCDNVEKFVCTDTQCKLLSLPETK